MAKESSVESDERTISEMAELGWFSLPDVPLIQEFNDNHTVFITSLNHSEFSAIAFNHCRGDDPDIESFPILKYNVISDVWSTVGSISKACMECMRRHYQIAFDQYKMYALSWSDRGKDARSMIMADLVSSDVTEFHGQDELLPTVLTGSELFLFGGVVHTIQGDDHFQWDSKQCRFIKIHTFDRKLNTPKLIHVASKNIIMLIDWENYEFHRFLITLQSWENVKCEGFTGFDEYEFERKPRYLEATLTPAEEHVIFCEERSYPMVDEDGLDIGLPKNIDVVWILDIRDPDCFKCRESITYRDLTCLSAGTNWGGGGYSIITTGGVKRDLLVIGWIKELFTTNEFASSKKPPSCVVDMIADWVSEPLFHCIQAVHDNRDGSSQPCRHRAIPLKMLLEAE